MPLKYLNRGSRDYCIQRIHPHHRKNWEFEIAVDGALAPKLSEGVSPEPKAATMWVFPPSMSHGWINRPNETIEIMVFHFAPPPEPLKSYVESRGYVGIELDSDGMDKLLSIYEDFDRSSYRPNLATELRFHKAYCELCLLLLDQVGFDEPLSAQSIAEARVENATTWYSSNLHNHPSLDDVAAATHISVAQLRRHFYAVRNQNPREVFQQIRFDHAIELIEQSDLSLEAIAETCGYGSLSAFSRAWKSRYGEPPGHTRRHSV